MASSDSSGRVAASVAHVRDVQARVEKMRELVRRFAGHPEMLRGAQASLAALEVTAGEAIAAHDLLVRSLKLAN